MRVRILKLFLHPTPITGSRVHGTKLSTIVKCFEKCGFKFSEAQDIDKTVDDIEETVHL